MLFNTFEFAIFFAAVYLLYVTLKLKGQNVLLLVASYVFYGWWDWRFLSLIAISTVVDYVAGIQIAESATVRRKRLFLLLSVVVNLGLLGTFKYFGFFAESLVDLLRVAGVEADTRFVKIVLPVGISFYTFQTMSYSIDIYRGLLTPTRNLLNFAVFVAFFPQLVAGPIERATRLLPQVERKRSITYAMLREGGWLVLLGYFKKVVLADNMSAFTSFVFDRPEEAHGLAVLAGVYAFAFQIYGDFSGYSDIARGISKMMGFDIMVNFRMPYFATNPSDFWRRWHISLSTWLRDYLYFPLGGNRHGRYKTYRNLLVTMVLGGLWHGAAWHFVAWGVFHGVILCIHRAIRPALDLVRPTAPFSQRAWHLGCVIFFFHVTCFGWLLFAVRKLGDVPVLMSNLVDPFDLSGKTAILTIIVFGFPILALQLFKERSGDMNVVKQWPRGVRLAVYSTLFALIILCGVPGGKEFIYFQF